MTVGELSDISGVTVRTLHHYDEVGLLVPSARTAAGYRIYDDGDIDRLRAILTYRELGLGLEEIAAAIDSPQNSVDVLRQARRRIGERMSKLRVIADSLDNAIAREGKEPAMTPEEKLSVFGDFDPEDHAEEARARWGDTAEYAQSTQRTANYTRKDWENIQAEVGEIYAAFVALERQGVDPAAPEVAALVARHRAHISQWYYECTPEIHAGLGQMYATDPRFAENIDKVGPGLASYMSSAIEAAYAD